MFKNVLILSPLSLTSYLKKSSYLLYFFFCSYTESILFHILILQKLQTLSKRLFFNKIQKTGLAFGNRLKILLTGASFSSELKVTCNICKKFCNKITYKLLQMSTSCYSITVVKQQLGIDSNGMLAVMMEVKIDSLGTLSREAFEL